MTTIAVLLTVFNRKDKTLQCLKRLYEQQSIEDYQVDVYLTNDGCTDGTPEAVKQQFPQVHIIHASGDLFWNRGMYTAWEEAAKKDYDFYLWLNDDTYTYPYMLKELLCLSEIKQNKAIVIGATESIDHSKPTYGGRNKQKEIPIPNGNPVEVTYFNGNIVLIPRNVYSRLGNLDYYFTHSKGDFDYGLRAHKANILMMQAGMYLGECDEHTTLDKWCDPDVPFVQRWKMLHRPNGMPPKETFHFEKKHQNLGVALFHYCTVHLRCICPWIWNFKQK